MLDINAALVEAQKQINSAVKYNRAGMNNGKFGSLRKIDLAIQMLEQARNEILEESAVSA
jgi:hypothetical protein